MNAILKQYVAVVNFLSQVMGPNYEIALHDLTERKNSIIAIANNHVSGRTLGAPLTDMALHFIADKVYESSDYQLNYSGVSKEGNKTRSSTMFIKDDRGTLIGMLCINCDTTAYSKIINQLQQLFCGATGGNELPAITSPERVENFAESVPYLVDLVLQQTRNDPHIPVERMTQSEKLQIVDALNKKGVFMLKGAVSEVATALHSSEASIYRYLSTLNKLQSHSEEAAVQ
ncbi:MAG: PAS domain-containing protein [Angelakisella sp.]